MHFDAVLPLSIASKVSAKKVHSISHDNEKRSKPWKKTYFLFEKWHEEFGELEHKQWKIWKFALWWANFISSM